MSFAENLKRIRKENEADRTALSSEEQSPRRILISSPDGKTIANCYKFRSSPHFSTSKKAPKYALLGVDDKSFWGDNTNVLGWYAKHLNKNLIRYKKD
ncbi:MAG: hypothetical protein IJB37_06050 [Peptococcaceae bacterium]|nr:hypothetical protein [Peptococcaceae bacterium]